MTRRDNLFPASSGHPVALVLESHLLICCAILAFFLREVWPLALFAGGWIIWQFPSPWRLYYLLTLFYPFAYTHYPKPTIGPVTINIDELLLVIMLVAMMFHPWDADAAKPSPPIRRSVLLVCLYSVAVLIACIMTGDSISLWISTIGKVLIFVATVRLIDHPAKFSVVIILLKVSAFMIAVSAILSAYDVVNIPFLNMKPSIYRSFLGARYASTGLIRSRGGFGINMAFVLPFGLYALVETGKHELTLRTILVYSMHSAWMGVVLWAIVISGSRSTWLMAAMVFSAFFLMYYRRTANPFLITSIVIPFLVFSALMFEFVISKVFHFVYTISPQGLLIRLAWNVEAIKMFLAHPFFGTPHNAIVDEQGLPISIHNVFLEVAAENGIIALVPVLLLYAVSAWMLFTLSQHLSEETRMFDICLLAGFAGILVELSFYGGGEKQNWMYLALVSAFYAMTTSGHAEDSAGTALSCASNRETRT